ncbi:MAG: cytochrome c biogenesis protein ResB [Pseudomonadota bacterium]
MKNKQTIAEQIWHFFCSVKLAVYTLVLIAGTSIIGTVIQQNASKQEYIIWAQNKLKLSLSSSEAFYNFITVLNIDDMYHAPWFLALILILCINIVVCSIERLSKTWKIIFPKQITFNKDRFRKQKNLETFSIGKDQDSLINQYETFLSKKIGKVIKEKTESSMVLYAEKGRWTRIGIYFVHSSILLLLVGALIGAIFGFKANLRLDEGQTSDIVHLSKGMPLKLDFSIRCNDFSVKFYDTGAPEEFKSNLTIIEHGKERFTKDIIVNQPLRYKGINIFQSSYGTAEPEGVVMDIVRLSDNQTITRQFKIGDEIDLPGDQGKFLLEGSIPHFDFRGQNLGNAFVGKITSNDGKSLQIGLPLRFASFDRMRKGTFAFILKETIQKYYTGLQITKDPGIWYVYAGFILMIMGCWVTFFMTHQSYMIEIQSSSNGDSVVSISGTSNRNNHGMKLKIKKILTQLKG